MQHTALDEAGMVGPESVGRRAQVRSEVRKEMEPSFRRSDPKKREHLRVIQRLETGKFQLKEVILNGVEVNTDDVPGVFQEEADAQVPSGCDGENVII
jgi:hypothetical protein